MPNPQEMQIPPEADRLLRLWADWNRRGDHGKSGYPVRSAGFVSGGASSADAFDHLCEDSDKGIAKAVDALVDALPDQDKAAVYYWYLGCAYRWHGNPARQVLLATQDFLIAARRKGIAQ